MTETILPDTVPPGSTWHTAWVRSLEFLQELGIPTRHAAITGKTILPGLAIESGVIVIDPATLRHPGDLLHEAGHIAVVPSAERPTLQGATLGTRPDGPAEEMMAIAWSYAACIHLDLDPGFVFHDDGYKGGGSYIAENFRAGRTFGLPMLQWKGMAADEARAAQIGCRPYPHMVKWKLD